MAVRTVGHVYLFEFKVVGRTPEGKAIAQLKERGYADKYRHLGEPIHLVGVEFSSGDPQHCGVCHRTGLMRGLPPVPQAGSGVF